ncbi:hypothetical protein BDN72DRAFT_838612 [Pluteus cervinus]|uniref:Uncharacterized protein n=1 Tax=Pluteus cervinus TaxID=181527 RepID=A0ACD3AY45_9AGAR|nr:hypothetical protein BDN72DRAFT_838612 [Pluteus cervinus]
MADIPPEIIEIFVLYLHEDISARHTHLARCCLVSRSWYTIAQPLLFSVIKIATGESDRQDIKSDPWTIPTFINTLEESPHIQNFVHSLSIEVKGATSLQPLLRLLKELHRLRLFFSHYAPPSKFHPDYFLCVHDVFRSDRFTSLSLTTIRDFPVGVFSHCVALQELALSRVTFASLDADPPPRSSTGPKPQLHTLVIFSILNEEISILPWLTNPSNPLDVSKLKTFLAMDRSDSVSIHRTVCKFASFVSSSLEVLLIDSPIDNEPSGILQVDEFMNLRTIMLWLFQDFEDSINMLPPIIDILRRLPNPRILEEVELLCEFPESEYQDASLLSFEDMVTQGWSEFDTLLTSSGFHNLGLVKLTVYNVAHGLTGQNYIDRFTSGLSALSESGKLCIETTKVDHYVSSQKQIWFT